jgi:hypothetical protein
MRRSRLRWEPVKFFEGIGKGIHEVGSRFAVHSLGLH